MTKHTDIYLSGWGSYHPEGRLTNDDIVSRIDTTHEWLETHIGILERRKVGPGETTTHMGAAAARDALIEAGIQATDIDLIVSSTGYDEMVTPPSSNRIAREIGAVGHGFDVKAACSGWFIGLDVASAMLANGRTSTVLVTAAENSAFNIDQTSRSGLPFFGDAAAAGVAQRDRPKQGLQVVATHGFSGNDHTTAVEVPTNGFFRMSTGETREWVEAAIIDMAKHMLHEVDAEVSDLRAFVCHQANLRLIERLAAQLGVPEDRHWHNVEWSGNTASAGAPSSLFEGIDANRESLVDGDLFLVTTVGAGLNATGTVFRWISD